MTDERKIEVWDELLTWIQMGVNDEDELVQMLRRRGFTDEEIADEFCMDIENFPPRED